MKKFLLSLAAATMSLAAMADATYVKLGERVSEITPGKYIIVNTCAGRSWVLYDNGEGETPSKSLPQVSTNLDLVNAEYIMEFTDGGVEGHVLVKSSKGRYLTSDGYWNSGTNYQLAYTRWDKADAALMSPCGTLNADGTVSEAGTYNDRTDLWMFGPGTGIAQGLYFNGNPATFAMWQNAHPYAIYTVGDSITIKDSDIEYANAVIDSKDGYTKQLAEAMQDGYGLVKEDQYYSANRTMEGDGQGISALLDKNPETYYHSRYDSEALAETDVIHYIQADLNGQTPDAFRFIIRRRHNNQVNRPMTVLVEGSNDGETWEWLSTETNLPTEPDVWYAFSDEIKPEKSYQHIRFGMVENSNETKYFTAAEFYVVESNAAVNSALETLEAAKAEAAEILAGNASATTKEALESAIATLADPSGVDTVVAPEVAQPEITIDLMGRKVTNIEGRRTLKKGNVTIVL